MLSLTRKNQGLLFGLATYIQWGFLSLFWKLLAGVSAYNTFSWRIVFTVVTMLTYALVAKQNTRFKKELVELWQDKKALLRMLLASFLIAANWLIYIYAVGHGQATQASLGYYIMPIVSILFALIFLRESLSRTMWAAVVLAFIGVLVLVANTGKLPMVSLGLALSFGFYGLIKKRLATTFCSYLSRFLFSRIIFFLFEHGNVSPSHIRCGDGCSIALLLRSSQKGTA